MSGKGTKQSWCLNSSYFQLQNDKQLIQYLLFQPRITKGWQFSWYSNAILVPVPWTLSTSLQFVPETIWHLKSKLHQFGLEVQKTARSTLHWVKRFTSGRSSKIKRDTACGSQFSETDPFLWFSFEVENQTLKWDLETPRFSNLSWCSLFQLNISSSV